MSQVFKKLNYKQENEILVLNGPDSFQREIDLLDGVKVVTSLDGVSSVSFLLAFFNQQQALDKAITQLLPLLVDDAKFWIAYPKKTSKRYQCDFSRDTGWDVLFSHGYKGVRQIAIDEDWSAIRFRKTVLVKSKN